MRREGVGGRWDEDLQVRFFIKIKDTISEIMHLGQNKSMLYIIGSLCVLPW